MKKFLQKKLKSEQPKEIIQLQVLLKQYDQQNRELNRQVLQLLQENTRLKMDKVQANIATLPPSGKRTVQDICYKHIQKYKEKEHSPLQQDRQAATPTKIGALGLATPSTKKQKQKGMEERKVKAQPQQAQFFSFGTAEPENHHQIPLRHHNQIKQQIPSSLRKGLKTPISRKTHPITQILATRVGEVSQSNLNKREDSLPCKPRTVHSIRPSPQITPTRSLSHINSTPTPTRSHPLPPPTASSSQFGRVGHNLPPKKRFMEVISIFVTPSRSGKDLLQSKEA